MRNLVQKTFSNLRMPKWMKSVTFQIMLCSIAFFVVLHFSYLLSEFSYQYDYKVGDTVLEDIIIDYDFLDVDSTRVLKDQVQYDVKEIYTTDASVYADAKQAISQFYNQAYDTREEYAEDLEVRASVFQYVLRNRFNLSQDDLVYLSALDEVELRLTESYVYDVLKEVLTNGVTDDNIIKQKLYVENYFSNIEQLSEDVKPILVEIVDYHVIVNQYVDEEATNRLIDERKASIDDVIIKKGSIIAYKDDELTEKAFLIINTFNLNNLHTFEQNLPLIMMDLMVVTILIILNIVLNYVYRKKRTTNGFIKEIYLHFCVVLLVYLITVGLGNVSIYLIPIATVAMLISILDNVTTGIIYSFFLSLIYGLTTHLSLELVAFTILASSVSALLVYHVFQRGKIFLAGLGVSLINVMVLIPITVVGDFELTTALEIIGMGVISGLLCSVITIGSLPFWEATFKVLTPLRLLEFANPNHPLMKKLLLEAPGTYHHSVLVANLSEGAAYDISCNALLTRVGAYYHDIGKIERPFLYVENQYDGQNPHDDFVPRVSAKVIKDHVKRGLYVGKQYKLPKEILAFIEQHHGTTMIQYFYHKAKDLQGDSVDKSVYTYNGPTPTSKEIGIVMMADSVEAAVRSLKQPDKKSVEELIKKIIQSKIDEHQLDDCDLTLKEIDQIKKSFVNSLSSAFHERIEYPDLEESEEIDIIK